MSAPFAASDGFSSGIALALAVVIGMGFGFVLERAGFGSSRRLAAQFYLRDMTVFKVMFTAIVTAMIGLFGLARVGWLDMDLVWVNPTFLWPQIAGGLLLGAGFIISGYCPGTCIVASASGKIDGILTLCGVTFGVGIFGAGYGRALEAFHHAGSHGRLLLSDLLHVDPVFLALGIAVVAGGAFAGAEAVERRIAARGARAAAGPRADRSPRARNVTIASLILAAIVFLVLRPAPARNLAEAAAAVPAGASVTPIELARHIVEGNDPWSIVDLRDAEAISAGSIPGALAIPAASLADPAAWPDRLALHRPVILVDGGDGAASRLEVPEPYRALVLTGGYPAWKSEILTPPDPAQVAEGMGIGVGAGTAAFRERAALVSWFTGGPAQAAPAPAAAAPSPAAGGGRKPKAAGGCS